MPGFHAEAPRATNEKLYGEDDPVSSPAFSDKVSLLQEIDAFARARDPRVVQVMASMAGERRVVEILRADGKLLRDVRPLVRVNVQVTVEKDGKREAGSSGAGGRAGFSAWISPDKWQAQVDEALRMALVNLDAVACPAGEMDVVLGPGWNGVLLHEAVGHGLEGDFNRKGISAFSGRIGERVAAKGVTVFDDGSLPGRRGSLTIDDEGTPDRAHRADRGRYPGGLHARPHERPPDGHGRHRQRPPPVLRPHAHAAHDQHRHAGGQRRPGRDDRLDEARPLLRQFRRRPGRHHQRQVRLPVHRGLPRSRTARSPPRSRAPP
jgi:TldD protein